jgi:hypothetical protein
MSTWPRMEVGTRIPATRMTVEKPDRSVRPINERRHAALALLRALEQAARRAATCTDDEADTALPAAARAVQSVGRARDRERVRLAGNAGGAREEDVRVLARAPAHAAREREAHGVGREQLERRGRRAAVVVERADRACEAVEAPEEEARDVVVVHPARGRRAEVADVVPPADEECAARAVSGCWDEQRGGAHVEKNMRDEEGLVEEPPDGLERNERVERECAEADEASDDPELAERGGSQVPALGQRAEQDRKAGRAPEGVVAEEVDPEEDEDRASSGPVENVQLSVESGRVCMSMNGRQTFSWVTPVRNEMTLFLPERPMTNGSCATAISAARCVYSRSVKLSAVCSG